MSETRALGRFTGDKAVEVAKHEAQALPDGMRDVTIVKPGHDLRPMNNAELDALMRQFGDARVGLSKDVKMLAVMHYLAQFDYTRHDNVSGALTGEAYITAPVETEVEETTTGDGKKKIKKAKGGGKKGKAVKAKANGKAKSNGAAKGDGLGREGTPARFIRELLAKGTDPEKIASQGAKKFPSNPITTAYVKWYQNDMKKKGLLKA
jgi:hypothetical protein